MDLIDSASTDVADDARLLADMLILPEGREGEQAFWNEEARALLTGLILHIAASAPPELRTLTHLRRLLTLAPDSAQQLLADMGQSTACHGLVARARPGCSRKRNASAAASSPLPSRTRTSSIAHEWRAPSTQGRWTSVPSSGTGSRSI